MQQQLINHLAHMQTGMHALQLQVFRLGLVCVATRPLLSLAVQHATSASDDALTENGAFLLALLILFFPVEVGRSIRWLSLSTFPPPREEDICFCSCSVSVMIVSKQ